MSKRLRITHLELSLAEGSINYDGHCVLTIWGHTAGGTSHKLHLGMGPGGIGHIGDALNSILDQYQRKINESKSRLAGT